MKARRMTRVRNETLLVVALAIFTFMNLVPLLWAALTPVAAHATTSASSAPIAASLTASTTP